MMARHPDFKRLLLPVSVSLVVVLLVLAGIPRRPKAHVRLKVPLHPEARNTMAAFQRALRDQAWEKALACCSDTVQAAAREYASPREFFDAVVPIEQITDLHRFNAGAKGYEGSRRLNVQTYTWGVQVTVDPHESPVHQFYEIVNHDGRWRIAFPCEPFDTWLEGIYQRREIMKGQLAQVAKAMAHQAAEERGEPAPTEAFLEEKRKEGQARRQERSERRRAERLVRQQHLASLVPRVEGVDVVLKATRDVYRLSEPMPLTLELISNADSALYYKFATAVRSLTILDEEGYIVAPQGPPFIMNMRVARIEPGQRVLLCDDYDPCATHAVDRPGRYRIEFNGYMLSVGDKVGADPNAEPLYAPVEFISNMVEVEVLR